MSSSTVALSSQQEEIATVQPMKENIGGKDASKPRRRFVGSKSSKPSSSSAPRANPHQIPSSILNDPDLNAFIAQVLPANYSFEIHKTIWHVRKNNATMVGLQMPEGLMMYACAIADLIERFTSASATILGDVTYGACCIDDYTAIALGCDMLIHYGHSCLVPSTQTLKIATLYVFVEIGVDARHVHESVRINLPSERGMFMEMCDSMSDEGEGKRIEAGEKIPIAGPMLRIEAEASTSTPTTSDTDLAAASHPPEPTRLALVSTIQFVAALQQLKEDLSAPYSSFSATSAAPSDPTLPSSSSSSGAALSSTSSSGTPLWSSPYECTIPRSKPLSPGEILGCTAPRLGKDVDGIIYLGDGRFHLEAIMIANPTIPAFRYDPYAKKITREWYAHAVMRQGRSQAIEEAEATVSWDILDPEEKVVESMETETEKEKEDEEPLWGVVLGTLGRQGSFMQLQAITSLLSTARTSAPIPYMPILLSELSPAKLALFNKQTKSSATAPDRSKSQHTRDSSRLNISTFIQTSCPRLSIDWGHAFDRPLLSPYECAAVLQGLRGRRLAKGKKELEVQSKDGSGEIVDTRWLSHSSLSSRTDTSVSTVSPADPTNANVGGKVRDDSMSREEEAAQDVPYPMDFYAAGTPWAVSRVKGVFV